MSVSYTDCDRCVQPETCEAVALTWGNAPLRRFSLKGYRVLRKTALKHLAAAAFFQSRGKMEDSDAELCIRELQRWCSALRQYDARLSARNADFQPDEQLMQQFQDVFQRLVASVENMKPKDCVVRK